MPKGLGTIWPAACVVFLAFIATPPAGSPAVAANDCLAAPRSPAPQGRHWYYRLDRANGRKCWYLGPQGRKVRQAAPQPAPAPPVESEAKPIAPLGPETAGDRLMPPTQLEQQPQAQQPQARTATEAGDAWPQAASPAPLPAAPIEAVAPSEPAVIAPPVAVERAAPKAQDTVADTVPQQIAVAAETTPSTAMGPVLLLAVAALAIAGIFLASVFKTARRRPVHVHRAPSWRSAAHEQTEPPYDSAIAPPLSPIEQTERHDEEGTVRNILRALQRRAA